jgi:hypothetical protein
VGRNSHASGTITGAPARGYDPWIVDHHPFAQPTTEVPMDQLMSDARRLASIGTFFVIVGWVFVIYALVAGVIWWIDLAGREAFNLFEALAISASAVGLPIFAAFAIAGFGYLLRLFALYVATKSQ